MEGLGDLFGGEGGSAVEVLTKLLEEENILMKTRVRPQQAEQWFKVAWLEAIQDPENDDRSGLSILMDIIQRYLTLVVSIDGNRAKNIMETIKDMKPELQQEPLMVPK